MKHIKLFSLLLIFSFGIPASYAEELPPLPPGPLKLTSTTPEMYDPQFWINRIQNAEAPIISSKNREAFNRYIEDLIPEQKNLYAMSATERGSLIQDELKKVFRALRARRLFYSDNSDVQKSFFDEKILPVLDVDDIPSTIRLKWGVAVRSTSVRALPTAVKTLEKPNDIEFDQFQFSLIKLWTPVAIIHTSSDRKWYFVQAPYTRGWVKSSDVAVMPSREEMKKFAAPSRFLVVTGESAPIYGNLALTQVQQKASMGTVLPFAHETDAAYSIWIPKNTENGVSFHKAYVSKKSDLSIGYKTYSQANMIRQAFKLLASRYGWGGAYNGRDCSGFTHDVFLSLGIQMPRNSQDQAFVGTKLGFFKPFNHVDDKIATLYDARPGITLLAMKQHMMLYIGEVNEKFYVIHSTWAERISHDSDLKNRINQVVVSDLSLNGNSYLGSLFDRIISMNEVAS